MFRTRTRKTKMRFPDRKTNVLKKVLEQDELSRVMTEWIESGSLSSNPLTFEQKILLVKIEREYQMDRDSARSINYTRGSRKWTKVLEHFSPDTGSHPRRRCWHFLWLNYIFRSWRRFPSDIAGILRSPVRTLRKNKKRIWLEQISEQMTKEAEERKLIGIRGWKDELRWDWAGNCNPRGSFPSFAAG